MTAAPSWYPVVEHFATFQGEGVHMGRRAFFVRLYGCDAKCHFCDSAATWHPDWKPANVRQMTARELVTAALAAQAPALLATPPTLFVLTGGEPALYKLESMVAGFAEAGYKTCIETAGHHPLPTNIDHVTLSPKVFAAPPLPENVRRADEFKIIVEDETSIFKALLALQHRKPEAPIWLHPEWSKAQDPAVLRIICDAVQEDATFRAGYQIHKLYKVDALSPTASTQLVPLGGNPQRGY